MRNYILPLAVILALMGTDAFGGDILNTKHNLSVSGPGAVTSTTEKEVCIFCHAPGFGGMTMPFLWNRRNKTRYYKPYQSSTLYATVGQPTGASKLCLSCHDGTIALGALFSKAQEIQFKGGMRFMPPGISRLGTDLSDDHPVSFVYDSTLAANNHELIDPAMLPPQIKFDKDGQLQCTACHDPHDNTFGRFLVISNQFSGLCVSCHEKTGWLKSSHSLSQARWNGQGPNPWPNNDYQSVDENGCENCHRPHTGEGDQRLLKYAFEEDNCLVCHNSNVAATDIEQELAKPNRHAVQDFTGKHDVAENFTSGDVPKHVECRDCHNPHQANSDASPDQLQSDAARMVPLVSGANIGVTGIDSAGRQIANAKYLYEICYKCHADYNVQAEYPITRQIDQLNTRLEFNLANPSFHPLESDGVNQYVPSLLEPYTIESIIECTDCHSTNTPGAAKGPHGSNFQYLLEKNYETLDFTQENSDTYALCYKCHSRDSILGDESFPKHRKHIVDQKTPCSVCHDPHGISNTQGNSDNNSHLINFELVIVQPNSQGDMSFEDLGTFAGQCSLLCHGEAHEPKTYP